MSHEVEVMVDAPQDTGKLFSNTSPEAQFLSVTVVLPLPRSGFTVKEAYATSPLEIGVGSRPVT